MKAVAKSAKFSRRLIRISRGLLLRFCGQAISTGAPLPLRISWSGGQFISKILAVTPDELIMDFGSQEYENQAVQRASQISIIAETQGAKVEFTLPQLKKGEYQRLPAFIS